MLLSGQTVSVFGDAFFNLAVMWVVWSETQSTLQTAVIQAIWHLPDVLFSPLAGVLADRRNRKVIMVTTNLGAAAVVGAVALIVVVVGHLPLVVALVAIFKLNGLTTFMQPARASVMPSVVGRDLLTTAQGLFATARETASLVGSAAAGLLIAVAGAVWALVVDAASFLVVSLCIALARLPGRTSASSSEAGSGLSVKVMARDLRDGWRTASRHPVVHALLWLFVLINVASFIGPLWPALVQERLGGGAASYGLLLAASAAGAMLGGLVAGPLERRFGAGRVLASSWSLAGICTLGIAVSTWLPATMISGIRGNRHTYRRHDCRRCDHDCGRTRRVSRPGLRHHVRGLGVALIPVSALARRMDRGVRGDMDDVRLCRGLHPRRVAHGLGESQCPRRTHLATYRACLTPGGDRRASLYTSATRR